MFGVGLEWLHADVAQLVERELPKLDPLRIQANRGEAKRPLKPNDLARVPLAGLRFSLVASQMFGIRSEFGGQRSDAAPRTQLSVSLLRLRP